MPKNRRARRAFDKKYRSGVWKACAGASALAAMVVTQAGLAPAANAVAPSVRFVDTAYDENWNSRPGTSHLSLREAIRVANPGDIIDITNAGSDLWVDGEIEIDVALTIRGLGDGEQQIHSYARTASDWGFNSWGLDWNPDSNLDWAIDGVGPDAGEDEGDDWVNGYWNDDDTVVGNTIFNIVPQYSLATHQTVASTVTFQDVAISGEAYYHNDDIDATYNNYWDYQEYHNYTPLITVDYWHRGSVVFDSATLENSIVTSSVANDYNWEGDGNFYVRFAAASGVANYSHVEGGDLPATSISFVNDSHIYNVDFDTVTDWDDQFRVTYHDRFWDGDSWEWSTSTDNWDGSGEITAWTPNEDTFSAVYSYEGDVNFIASFAENNYSYVSNYTGSWFRYSYGSVFGLVEGNLTIEDSFISGNDNELGDGGVGFLENGNLYISGAVDGQTEIFDNDADFGHGGAFSLDYGNFDINGDVVFSYNSADVGGAISQYIPEEYDSVDRSLDEVSKIGDGVQFNRNRSSYDGGAIHMFGDLQIAGAGEYGRGVEFNNNIAYDGVGGAISHSLGDVSITYAYFDRNYAWAIGEGNWQGLGGAFAEYDNSGWTPWNSFDDTHLYIGKNTRFEDNRAEYNGGALAVFHDLTDLESGDSLLEIRDSSFAMNHANGNNGGAIWVSSNDAIDIHGTAFQTNYAGNDGGAIWLETDYYEDNDVYIGDESWFQFNQADVDGGAIYAESYLTVKKAEFLTNFALDGDGGAIDSEDGMLVRESYFTGNAADYDGGAIGNWGRHLAVYDSTFVSNGWDSSWWTKNIYAQAGGAIYADSGATVVNSEFDYNQSDDEGGAIYQDSNDEGLYSIGSTFNNNYADNEGGALYSNSKVVALNSTFSSNQANSDDGSAIYGDDDVFIAMSTFVNEDSYNFGPDVAQIVYAGDDLYLFGSVIASNNGTDIIEFEHDGYFFDDGYNITNDYNMFYDNLDEPGSTSRGADWSDFEFGSNYPEDNGGMVKTIAIGDTSVAVRAIRYNRIDVPWILEDSVWLPNHELYSKQTLIRNIIKDDARGTHRGNMMDVGAYENTIMSGGGGSVDASPSEPVVEPTPTPTPETTSPVVVNIRGFAPGSPKLTKALKAEIKAEVEANSTLKAVLLRGFTVTAADMGLAKARANNVKNYILKLVPDMATKVLKGKLGKSRKVKLTFKDSL